MIKIFVDGGTLRNGEADSPAASGCVFLKYTEDVLEHWRLLGKRCIGSNNVAELGGAIEAISALKSTTEEVIISSDSQYVIKGITQWVEGWKKRGWITGTGSPVANKNLWEKLLQLNRKQIQWQHVKGHSGELGNELADHVCTTCMKVGVDIDLRGCGGNLETVFETLRKAYPQIKRRR